MRSSLYRFSPEKYPALTGIRAIAAFLVFFHHYANTPQVSGPLCGFLGEGHVGVTLFYVLSGFLITYNYSQKADLGKGFWYRYVSRRVGRIYPLYFTLLTLTYVLTILSHASPPTAKSLFLNVTLWKGFFDDYKFDGIAPSWSLTVEETFYFLAPFLFLAVRRVGHVAVQVSLYCIGGLLLLLGSHIPFDGFFGNFRFVASYTFFGRSFEFVLGMVLAQALLRRPGLLASPGRRWLTYLGLAGSALVMFWMSLLRHGAEFGVFHPVGIALNNLALPMFVCILFCGLLSERTLFGRMLGSAPLVFLGRTSYAFYLVHYGVFATLVGPRLEGLDVRLQVGVLFLAVNAISALLFLLVEHPANTLIRRWADRFADRPSRAREIGRPVRRLPRGAVAWACSFTVVTAVWSGAASLGRLDERLQSGILFLAASALSAILFLFVEHPANTLMRRWGDRVADWPSSRIGDPGRRLRRIALAWACSFTLVFALWRASTSVWTNPAVSASSVTADSPQPQIDIPEFANPLSAHTDYGFITSRAGQMAGLTYKVGRKQISGKPFIFAHANSRLEYDIAQKGWSVFEFSTGLDDVGGRDLGTVVYVVRGDGKELFRSPVVRALQPPHSYRVGIAGVQRLELAITDAGDGIISDEAYWIHPVLR